MSTRLTDADIKRLLAPKTGNRITFDGVVRGLGIRVTAAGARSFILAYRTRTGQQRRYTIGSFPDWTVPGAREEAKKLKRVVDGGGDPLAEIAEQKAAPTVDDLLKRVTEEHLPRKQSHTQAQYRRMFRLHIRPALGRLKVSEVRFGDCDSLHRRITRNSGPAVANRCMALLSRCFTLAIKWEWCETNPVKGVERNTEVPRKRYLNAAELKRLTDVLDRYSDQQAAEIIRLLLLTGARKSEVLSMKWEDVDLQAGTWSKPAASTKQGRDHVVPLAKPAIELLTALRRKTNAPVWVFPANGPHVSECGHRVMIWQSWLAIRKLAGITNLRLHDLRHSFASQLASSGASLSLIGQLLGHTQPQTTARYSHLFDDVQREAVERVGKVVANGGRR
jgi:integrase